MSFARSLVLVGLVGFASAGPSSCGGGGSRDRYVDSVYLPVDCHAAPSSLFAFEPARPRVVFAGERVTADGGATWRGIYDGVRVLERITPPVPLGDGRWFTVAEPLDGSGKAPYVVDPVTARARKLVFDNVTGPAPSFRRAKVDVTTWVGLDAAGRVWTSADGASWIGRDQQDAAWLPPSGVAGTSFARGSRVWSVGAQNATGGTELRVSMDGGKTFAPRDLPEVRPGERYQQVRYVALGSGGRAIIGFYHPGVTAWPWRTEDDGLTWVRVGGDPEWIERTGVVLPALLADDTLVMLSEQNMDAARPEPAGFYLVRSTDWGRTWQRLVMNANGAVVPPALSLPVLDLGGGRFAFGTSRSLVGAEAVNGPGTKAGWCVTGASGSGSFVKEYVEEPARTAPPKPTITSPAPGARVSSPVRVTGRGVPGNSVTVSISGTGQHFDGLSRIVPDEFTADGTAAVGADGTFVVDVTYPRATGGSTLGISASQTDGYLTSERLFGLGVVDAGPPPPPAPVIVRPTSSYLRTPFTLIATATPGATVKTWVVDRVGSRREFSLTELPAVVPPSGELQASVVGLDEYESLYLGVETAGGLAFTSVSYIRWQPGGPPPDPPILDAPSGGVRSPVSLAFRRVEPYALLHVVLTHGTAVLGERHDITFEERTTGTATLTYVEPPAGTVMRLRLWETNKYGPRNEEGVSRETEYTLTQQ